MNRIEVENGAVLQDAFHSWVGNIKRNSFLEELIFCVFANHALKQFAYLDEPEWDLEYVIGLAYSIVIRLALNFHQKIN